MVEQLPYCDPLKLIPRLPICATPYTIYCVICIHYCCVFDLCVGHRDIVHIFIRYIGVVCWVVVLRCLLHFGSINVMLILQQQQRRHRTRTPLLYCIIYCIYYECTAHWTCERWWYTIYTQYSRECMVWCCSMECYSIGHYYYYMECVCYVLLFVVAMDCC